MAGKWDRCPLVFVLTVSRASSLLFLCRLDVGLSGRMKSSAVVGRPGYRKTSSCSGEIPETCSEGTRWRSPQHPRWSLKFVLKLSDIKLTSDDAVWSGE